MCNQFPDPGFLFDLHCIRESICNRFQVLREGCVEIGFFRQVQKSSDPASLTFCCGVIFRLRQTIFVHLVDNSVDYRSLQKYPDERD